MCELTFDLRFRAGGSVVHVYHSPGLVTAELHNKVAGFGFRVL
jgi:hypothetical protein